jgi:hypothetical protein
MTKKNIRRTKERKAAPHHMLLSAARHAYEAAVMSEVGGTYSQLVAMTFSALALEAMCNAFGDAVIRDWDDFERAAPLAKLRLVAEQLGLEYDRDVEPWASAKWLISFRNLIAHARIDPVRESALMTEAEHEADLKVIPQSKLEKKISLDHARRAVTAVDEIKKLLLERVPEGKAFGLGSDEWSGSSVWTGPRAV